MPSRKALALNLVARAVAPSSDLRLILRDVGVMNVALVSPEDLRQLEALLPMHAEVGAPMEDPQCVLPALRPPSGCAVLSIEQYRDHADTVTVRVRVTGQTERGEAVPASNVQTEFKLAMAEDTLRIVRQVELPGTGK